MRQLSCAFELCARNAGLSPNIVNITIAHRIDLSIDPTCCGHSLFFELMAIHRLHDYLLRTPFHAEADRSSNHSYSLHQIAVYARWRYFLCFKGFLQESCLWGIVSSAELPCPGSSWLGQVQPLIHRHVAQRLH